MDHRGEESPMDFQWDNQSGRVDPNSPFRMSGIESTYTPVTPVKKNTTPLTREHTPFHASPIKQPSFTRANTAPAKPTTPYRERIPPPRFQTPAFRTPHHSTNDPSPSRDSDIFDTPGSARDTDSEAPTPDMHIEHLLRGKRSGLSGLSIAPSRVTGRGELRRGIQKPRRRRHRHPNSDDEDSDSSSVEYAAPKKMRKGAEAEHWVNTHQHIPTVVSGYLRLVVHASWVSLLVFILFSCFRVVRQDMLDRVDAAADVAAQAISQCQMNYVINRCAPDLRVRAIEEQCIAWETCMNQDPAKVGTAKVSAATIAAILNGFVAELHWKTLAFVLIFGITVWMSNSWFTPKPVTNHYTMPASPMPSHWIPPNSRGEGMQHYQQPPWATPMTTKRKPVDYQQTPHGEYRTPGEHKSLEWR